MAIPKPKSALSTKFVESLDTSRMTAAASDNMKADRGVNMTFNVTTAFHKRYKQLALSADLSMKELLEQSLELWIQKHGKQ